MERTGLLFEVFHRAGYLFTSDVMLCLEHPILCILMYGYCYGFVAKNPNDQLHELGSMI